MRFTRDERGEGPIITGIVGRGFRVDEGVYEGLLITPERADGWDPPALADLGEDDLAPILALDPVPEFLILGTGAKMLLPPPRLTAALEARGIGIEPMDSRAAARAWGVLRAELRWVAGALYPLD
ncbi:Mth938-like domain-containing protein [Stakelama saccharophila]|uniref:Mth938-like domain-containing protein n=1 Tax=Stakelama saccharophila TaxID=3075605 RepID=A0ABZ0BBD9_9SPHN|nr:Mth938-like domain-containing protein [Stakelama sp. W311]WNO54391.1 Mth938-like domain-containing protein [Stakelama sp. W311]